MKKREEDRRKREEDRRKREDEHIARLVTAAPEPTDEQIAKIRLILHSGIDTPG